MRNYSGTDFWKRQSGGFVAAQNPEIYREEQQRKAEEHLLAAAEIARVSGISLESLVQALTIFYREEE